MAKEKKTIIPKFTSEAQDARWHDRHKRELESAVERRIKEGSTLTLRQAVTRAKLRAVTIRLATEDIDRARACGAEGDRLPNLYQAALARSPSARSRQAVRGCPAPPQGKCRAAAFFSWRGP